MLLLTSTSDKIKLVTASAVTMDVHASWVDNASGTVTPGRTNTETTTATTTDVVSSPGASTQRTIKTLIVRNTSVSSQNEVTISHYDGSLTIDLFKAVLKGGESIVYSDETGFVLFDSDGLRIFGDSELATRVMQSENNSILGSILASVMALAGAKGLASDLRVTLLGGTTAVTGSLTSAGTVTTLSNVTSIGGLTASPLLQNQQNVAAVLSNINNVI